MNKVLIITYYWPPSGGAGVQRWLKFAMYLPEFGWEPVILTVDPAYAAYPAIDLTLEKELTSNTEVHKTFATDWFRIYSSDKSKVPAAGFATNQGNNWKGKVSRFIRGNFFIPDPRRGWNRYAFKKACELIEKHKIVTIVTTSPPHSTQLIGIKLKKKYNRIKWIADLRDPWTDIYYYNQFYPGYVSRAIDRKLEKKVLELSDYIITVGKSLKELFSEKIPGISGKIHTITNGFDEDDFKGLNVIATNLFTISYIGTLSQYYPIEGFLEAIAGIKKNGIAFSLRFVGSVSMENVNRILAVCDSSSVEFIPYVNHSQAIKYMLNTDILLLIIPDNVSNKSIITGKIFEYIASGKPVLCIGPADGDAAEIIKSSGTGITYNYKDKEGIESFINSVRNNNNLYINSPASVFSRRNLTSRLADILRS